MEQKSLNSQYLQLSALQLFEAGSKSRFSIPFIASLKLFKTISQSHALGVNVTFDPSNKKTKETSLTVLFVNFSKKYLLRNLN